MRKTFNAMQEPLCVVSFPDKQVEVFKNPDNENCLNLSVSETTGPTYKVTVLKRNLHSWLGL